LASYGSEAFMHSILQVYSKDCPEALTRLAATLKDRNIEAARHAIHSLANIMGVVGPVSSRTLIDSITDDLNNGKLEAAASTARKLESMVQAVLVSIQAWLDGSSRHAASHDAGLKGGA
jgi:hypothetical protein